MNASILHQATPLTLVFAGSLSEAGSAHTCNHSLSSFESNPTKTIQTELELELELELEVYPSPVKLRRKRVIAIMRWARGTPTEVL